MSVPSSSPVLPVSLGKTSRVRKSSHKHALNIPAIENALLDPAYLPLPPTLHLKPQEDRHWTLAWGIWQILKSSSVAGHSNMHLSLSLSAFDWLYILWGGDHSLLLLKEYYITVQRKWIRTGKKTSRREYDFQIKWFKLNCKLWKSLQCFLSTNQYRCLN